MKAKSFEAGESPQQAVRQNSEGVAASQPDDLEARQALEKCLVQGSQMPQVAGEHDRHGRQVPEQLLRECGEIVLLEVDVRDGVGSRNVKRIIVQAVQVAFLYVTGNTTPRPKKGGDGGKEVAGLGRVSRVRACGGSGGMCVRVWWWR